MIFDSNGTAFSWGDVEIKSAKMVKAATGVGLRSALGAALLALLAALLFANQQSLSSLFQPPVDDVSAPSGSFTPSSIARRLSLERQQPLDRAALAAFAASNSVRDLHWGTYRSGLYFGLRSRSFPAFVSAGLLWTSQHEDVAQLRYECRQEDRLQKYGWLQHDGRAFGDQRIEDQHNHVALRTLYARLGERDEPSAAGVDGWAARVLASHLEPRDERLKRRGDAGPIKLSLFFFVDLGCGDERVEHPCREALKDLMEVTVEPAATSQPCSSGGDDEMLCSHLVVESSAPDEDDDEDSGAASSLASAPLAFQLNVQLRTSSAAISTAELRYAGLKDAGVLNIKEKLVARAEKIFTDDGKPTMDREILLDNSIEDGSTLVVVQAVVEVPDVTAFHEGDVVLDVVLNEGVRVKKPSALSELTELVSETLADRAKAFESKFEDTFQLSTKRFNDPSSSSGGADVVVSEQSAQLFNESHIRFAKAAFSNLIGGIGYFYGSSLVQHDPEKPSEVAESPVKPLFTAVPSRSFFPRGFLWDEGFHQFGIAPFDYRLSQDIVVHWLNLMEDDGYIAREQILGETARRRVPGEFLVQHVEHANPPTLLLAVEKIVQHGLKKNAHDEQRQVEMVEYVRLIFPFLERWYDWFMTTQRGPHEDNEAASMRWRGRNSNDGKLIANTLSSGLDDYPRASRPSAKEMHVDLLSWMVKSSEIMAQLAELSGFSEKAGAFEQERERYARGLDRYHWNEQLQSYFDVGEHSANGKIDPQVVIRCRDAQGNAVDATAPVDDVQRRRVRCPPSHPQYMFPLGDGRGGLQLKEVFIPGTVSAALAGV